ncbi:MAG TPA: DUF4197 domain-containing protein [Cyclobacteriaceae bacterium]|nr:DUF4197 domain-containing protein [Cyclobacteriaceae bacterium]
MKAIKILLISMLLNACTAAQINQTLGDLGRTSGPKPLTAAEVAEGLKEALIQGTNKGADIVSQADGYLNNPRIKIPFPPDVKRVEDRLRQIGLGNEVDRFVTTLNRGAEEAAKEAKPIFVSAIRSMTIEDAFGILRGEENAATQYLQRTTSAQLKQRFLPVIQSALEKTNATRYYTDLVSTYNKIPLVERVNPDLDDYATDKAIEGLFYMIAIEEKNIRENPGARATDLLKRVFGSNN